MAIVVTHFVGHFDGKVRHGFDPIVLESLPVPKGASIETYELAIQIRIEKLPEGLFLATSGELQGLLLKAAPSPKPSKSPATSPASSSTPAPSAHSNAAAQAGPTSGLPVIQALGAKGAHRKSFRVETPEKQRSSRDPSGH